jgi:hypothetical protein
VGRRQIRDVVWARAEEASGKKIEQRRIQQCISSTSLIHERHGLEALAESNIDKLLEEMRSTIERGNASKAANLFRLSGKPD